MGSGPRLGTVGQARWFEWVWGIATARSAGVVGRATWGGRRRTSWTKGGRLGEKCLGMDHLGELLQALHDARTGAVERGLIGEGHGAINIFGDAGRRERGLGKKAAKSLGGEAH